MTDILTKFLIEVRNHRMQGTLYLPVHHLSMAPQSLEWLPKLEKTLRKKNGSLVKVDLILCCCDERVQLVCTNKDPDWATNVFAHFSVWKPCILSRSTILLALLAGARFFQFSQIFGSSLLCTHWAPPCVLQFTRMCQGLSAFPNVSRRLVERMLFAPEFCCSSAVVE
jgi:hypothetical protein